MLFFSFSCPHTVGPFTTTSDSALKPIKCPGLSNKSLVPLSITHPSSHLSTSNVPHDNCGPGPLALNNLAFLAVEVWPGDTAPEESRPQGAGKNCKSISEARGTLRRLFHSRLFGVKVSWRRLRQRWKSSAERATLLVSGFNRRSERLPAVSSSAWHLRSTLSLMGGLPLACPGCVFEMQKHNSKCFNLKRQLTNDT